MDNGVTYCLSYYCTYFCYACIPQFAPRYNDIMDYIDRVYFDIVISTAHWQKIILQRCTEGS